MQKAGDSIRSLMYTVQKKQVRCKIDHYNDDFIVVHRWILTVGSDLDDLSALMSQGELTQRFSSCYADPHTLCDTDSPETQQRLSDKLPSTHTILHLSIADTTPQANSYSV